MKSTDSVVGASPLQIRRFWARIHVDEWTPDACWEHINAPAQSGYVNSRLGRLQTGAHRVAFILVKGMPAPGQVIRHLCGNRRCCRPDHLEAGTPSENRRDSIEAGTWKAKPCGKRLTDVDVVDIRWRRHVGESVGSLCDLYGVQRRTIQLIANGTSYPHLPGPITPARRTA